MSFISDDPVLKYVKNLDKKGRKTEFDEVFKNNSKELMYILDQTLKFNPYFRNSASECIKTQVFDEVRDKKKEISAPYKITLDIDRDEAFDYTNGVS